MDTSNLVDGGMVEGNAAGCCAGVGGRVAGRPGF